MYSKPTCSFPCWARPDVGSPNMSWGPWGRPPVRVLYRGARRPCSARRVRLDRDLAAWRTLTQQRAQLAAAAEATGEALEAQV